jgi:hypothetical protein
MNQDVAPKWPSDRFDMVWLFTWSSNQYQFTQVPQLLLADDSDKPIK